jgi:flagellar protein FlgJ
MLSWSCVDMKITSMLPNVAAEHLRGEALPIEKLAGNKSLSETEKVSEVSRQFESVLLRQILGQARKTTFNSKFNPDSMTSGIYQDMVTNQLAESISRSGSFGLARSLEAQLVRQTVNPAEAGGATRLDPAPSPVRPH